MFPEPSEFDGIDWEFYNNIVCKVSILCNDGDPNLIGTLLTVGLWIGSVVLGLTLFGIIMGIIWGVLVGFEGGVRTILRKISDLYWKLVNRNNK